MEIVGFNGWKRNVRLTNEEVDLIVTKDVGPRILRFGFIGERNVFQEIKGQQGGTTENEWMNRGGHRLWIAPEEEPVTYELDNGPVEIEETRNGIRTKQPIGELSGVEKQMEISLARDENEVCIVHYLTNRRDKSIELAPWALSVMVVEGMLIIPLPTKIPHADRLTPNQQWSLWGYTDFSDPRWILGPGCIFFRGDINRGPNKLGIAHREKWVAYQLEEYLFVKYFDRVEGAEYPDGGVNFETFANEEFLEIETLGPLVTLTPGDTISHKEKWKIFRGVPTIKTENDVDKIVKPLVG